jgi:hypothetical protein
MPNDRYLLIWEFIQFMVIVTFFFIISIDLIFSEQIWDFETDSVLNNFNIYILSFLISLLLADIFVRFNVAYAERGRIIRERKKIIINYLVSFSFLIDFVSLALITADYFYK